MKMLLIASLLILSNTVFSAERTFECNAHYIFGDKKSTVLKGTITSETSLSDVVYSIDEQVEFDAALLTKTKDESVQEIAFYQPFKIAKSTFTLLMPERMDNRDTFTAIVGNGKSLEKLECFSEN
ncbi:MAG: hypothetical protein H7336_08940 [Bacteriovorax sp.]|nr:hypothetical protein [Bacteriovorax sp.]